MILTLELMIRTISYRVLNFYSVFMVLSDYVICKKCGGNITFSEKSARGLGFQLVIQCAVCEPVNINSCPLIGNGYEINKRFVFAMRMLGLGLAGAEKFCAFMDLPRPIFHSYYDRIIQSIHTAVKAVCELSMAKAVREEIAATTEKLKTNEIDGISVSGDGSWKTRGFKSLYGFASLMGVYSGKVIDISTKSSFCKACSHMSSKVGTPEYDL